MLDILKIIYQFEHHAATTFEISLVREKLGYVGEKSYNSLIAHNGKRVKEFLKKDAIIRENGEELFWGIFFDGEQLDGKTVIHTQVRVGRSAVSGGWTLNRQDLNEFLPVENFEGVYPITVDGIEAEGRFNVNSRVFYKSDELRKHLEQLAEENPNQKIPLKLELKDENKRGFQFKLKKELVKAIETLYEDLEVKYPHSLKILEELNDVKYDFAAEDFEEDETFIADSFYDYLKSKGYLFDKETIENYLLSLKVKPFAILTGNSGTGKTKLSQLFSQYLIENRETGFVEDYISVKVPIGTNLKENSFQFTKKVLRELLNLNRYEGKLEISFNGVKSKESIGMFILAESKDENLLDYLNSNNFSEVDVKIKKQDIKDSFVEISQPSSSKFSFERNAGKNYEWTIPKDIWSQFIPIKHKFDWNIIVDGITSTARLTIWDVRIGAVNSKNIELNNYLNSLDEKDTLNMEFDLSTFEPIESKGQGVSIIEEQLLSKENDDTNYKIIPVGANWTENRHIVGYYNVITNEYQDTPAYKLIKQAKNSSEPHFLILDEMNLSHVERYFADFLSAIESGEKIPLYGEEELTLPQNLFIIGTVNVDETTYMFSPKVLDRANVIEFETHSASDYMKGNIKLSSPSGNISYLEDPLAGNEIRSYGIDELRDLFGEVTVDGDSFWNLLTDEIYSFQKILKESGFDFGFRVINEIVRFMAVAWEYEGKPDEFNNWTRYFDACIKQKLLPKLHGSEKIIGETLDKLYAKSVGEHLTYETSKYPDSARKLHEMREVLRKQRYVSFIN